MKRSKGLFALYLTAQIVLAARILGDEQAPGANLPEVVGDQQAEPADFDISQKAYNSILVMKRDDGGEGTGFIVKREIAGKERFFVYTNQHVIAGCKTVPKALRTDGSAVRLGKLVTAVNYDVAVFTLDEPESNFLELQSDVAQNVRIGAQLATPGNAGGSSTITFKFGKLLAIGPQVVEIDAMIKGGNSGGPILGGDGRVMGIVSYFVEETVDDPRVTDADKKKVVRRFGYRLDNVKSWETPDWRRFVSQGERVDTIESTSEDLLKLMDSGFKSWNGNEQIGKIMGALQKDLNSARSQKEVYGDLARGFGELKAITMTDLNSVAADPSLYWWWKQKISEQREFREGLDESLAKKAAEAEQKR